jgi:hypothetical protein
MQVHLEMQSLYKGAGKPESERAIMVSYSPIIKTPSNERDHQRN